MLLQMGDDGPSCVDLDLVDFIQVIVGV